MTDRDPTTPRITLVPDPANDVDREPSLAAAVESWHAALEEDRVFHETGELPDPRMSVTDVTGAVDAIAVEVALAPARTLEELTLKAEVADYFLGGSTGLRKRWRRKSRATNACRMS